MILSALRNARVVFVPLPKLDGVGSRPIARSLTREMSIYLTRLPVSPGLFSTGRLSFGYRCPATFPASSWIFLCERRFRTPAIAQRLVRLAQDVV
jgi:hypothetical protein